MLSVTERIFFLAKVPLFSDLGLDSQTQLAAIAEEVTFQPGEDLFQQGDVGDSLYVVLDGEVAILLDGHEVNRMKPGESFGEIAVLDKGTRTAGGRAVSDVLALRIDRRAVEDLMARSSELRLAIVAELGSRIRAIKERIRQLADR